MLEIFVKKRFGNFTLEAALRLPTPGIAALFGPSGCGKSTLVNVIAGLIVADEGRVVLDETVLTDTQRHIEIPAEKRRIGYVFQDARLFPHLRVAANLKYAQRRAVGERVIGFDDVVSLLNLEPLLARRTHRLSGGERQRVAIGRALLSQPKLLLLDEPLSSLDRERREEVLPYLETLRDVLAIPMVYVSHQFDEVRRLATHVVLMQAGRVVSQGSLGEIALDRHLREVLGPDAIGAVIEGIVLGQDRESGLTLIKVGHGELRVLGVAQIPGSKIRVQLLARDIIVATQMPQYLSIRNNIRGVVSEIIDEDAEADLIGIDIGGTVLLARVTKAATRELALAPGVPAWALIKAVSLRAARAAPRTDAFPNA